MFSARLRSARKKKNLSQEKLAELVGTTKATISNYENEYSSPSNEMLIKLSDVLDVTTDYLLGRSDRPDLVKSNMMTEVEIEELFINNPKIQTKYKGRELTDEEMVKVAKMLEVILDREDKSKN
ncbi:helix-turn-helix domain-containing protein [Laceyella putida]|uniref:Helix-turn-helix domain-containing protein n=1 Tax=Laceyella putida TaxID=110101 RepID=A0ABW2RK99_9BACL